MSLIEKIDEMKAKAQRLIVNPPHDSLDEIANDISEGYITACDELKEIVLAEQKEPCEYCKENRCWLCEFAGECRTVKHCHESSRADYKPRQNFCHVCGRNLSQPYTDAN